MRVVALAPGFAAAFLLAACGARPLAKSEAHLQPRETTQAAIASIPDPVRGVPLPPAPRARDQELRYSVVVANQPVRDVLLAMARETQVNFDIHPDVEGSVTINAVDQTLKQILTRMARQVDMRWEQNGATISVMKDTPFLRTYHIDYVNMARDVTESVGIATQVISGTVGGTAGVTPSGTGSGNNNSTLTIASTAKNHFWESLEKNVKDLLRETDKELPAGSSETYVRSRGAGALATTQARTAAATRRATTNASGSAAAVEGPGETQSTQASESIESRLTFREAASVIVNPETGVISVRATSRQHEKVQEFLEQVAGASKRQVLIEATIVEVDLSDNYQAGVDWSALGLSGLGYTITQTFAPPSLPSQPSALGTSFFSVHYNNPNAAAGGSISSTVKLLDQFGKTRVLSSPKLMVINNQTAVLKVVDNRVYFTVKADTVTNQTTSTTTFTTTQNVVPVGFIMNVTPQISDADQITLNLRPTVTRIIDTVADPNPSLAAAGVTSLIPVTQTREMESVLKVASGQTAVLGGLMLDSFEGRTNGLPIASRIPILGDLVSQRNDLSRKSELVVFIRPVVIRDPSLETDLADYRRYLPDDGFFKDTRPPLPELQRELERMEQGKLPHGRPNAVVPDPSQPSPGGQT
ncbi:MAG TPA: pilus (MSHA type) biogenesis protein MshL [Usitatibacter sp.]|jgi:general secretion pathway protein D|nr:pilus (MSHA type) biogenesis protein MshL [Usitatibacter sp.]